jgi:hypothetical protein
MDILNESMPVARYLKSVNGGEVVTQLLSSKPMVDFIRNHINTAYPAKKGKQGLWIRGDNATPVLIADVKETSVILKKLDGQPWEELYELAPVFDDPGTNTRLILPNEKADIYNYEDAKIFMNYLAYEFIESNEQNIDQFINKTFSKHKDSLAGWVNQKDKFKSIQVDPSQVASTADNQARRKSRSNKAGGEGTTFIGFNDGWQWLDLDKGYCQIEGNAAGHCGNSNPRSGDNILSLRDPDNRIHMTVVVDSEGYTTEMKAPGNRKPSSYTHPYVVDLLLNDKISGVGQGRYLPENDFKITDLNMQLAAKLSKAGKLGEEFNDVMNCAVKANGDQDLFAKLIVQSYDLVDFNYGFDYNKQAILLDSAEVSYFINEYDLTVSRSNQYDSWSESVEPNYLDDLFKREVSLYECRSYIAAAWRMLPNAVKEGLWSTVNNGPLPDHYKNEEYGVEVADKLYAAAKKNENLKQGLLRTGSQARVDTRIEQFNNLNREMTYYNDGFYVNVDSEKTMSLYINTKGADEQLRSNKSIQLPESLNIEYEWSDGAGYDQLLASLQSDPFWAKKIHTDQGQSWSQELEGDQGLKQRQQANYDQQAKLAAANQHPMQIYVRNEQEILPKLEQAYMYGGLEEYIQQLRQLGWWDSYVQWAEQNNKFLPIEN